MIYKVFFEKDGIVMTECQRELVGENDFEELIKQGKELFNREHPEVSIFDVWIKFQKVDA